MKIRKGFVSNSSSSSFCIYGAMVDQGELVEALVNAAKLEDVQKNILESFNRYKDKEEKVSSWEDFLKEVESLEEYFSDDTYYLFDEFVDIEIFSITYDYDYYVGRSFDTIGDDETGREFKESTEKKLAEIFGKELKCGHHEEAWRDG